jgi:Cytochrome P450
MGNRARLVQPPVSVPRHRAKVPILLHHLATIRLRRLDKLLRGGHRSRIPQRRVPTSKTPHLTGGIAAEATDHMLAGSDTTADTLTYMVWQISRPGFQPIQDRLREELKTVPFDATGLPVLRPIDKLPCLYAVVNETLKVYPAIPMSEQRVAPPRGAEIFGYYIPGGTVCSL